MNIVLIRTDNPLAELYLYDDHECLSSDKWEAHRILAETLHKKINQMLKAKGLDMDSISAIAVFKGPGSFTGLRIGHTVANAMAYSLNVPIVTTEGEAWIDTGINRLLSGGNDKLAMPEYGAPVHITKPKK